MNKKFLGLLVMLLAFVAHETPVLVASSEDPQGPSNPIVFPDESDSDDFSIDSEDNEDFENQPIDNLLAAVLNPVIDTLLDYLYFNPSDIHARNVNQASILHMLAAQDNVQLSYDEHLAKIQILVSAGADINAQNLNGETPLHKAAMYGHLNALQALIDAHANVNAQDFDGQTPLDTIHPSTQVANEIRCRNALIAAGASE